MSNVYWKDVVFRTIYDVVNANDEVRKFFDGMVILGDNSEKYPRNSLKIKVSDVRKVSDYKAKGSVYVHMHIPDSDLDTVSDVVDDLLNEKWHIGIVNLSENISLFLRKNGIKVDMRNDQMSIEYQFYAVLEGDCNG